MNRVEAAELLEELRNKLHVEFNQKQAKMSKEDRAKELKGVLRYREALAEGANCLRNIEQWRMDEHLNRVNKGG